MSFGKVTSGAAPSEQGFLEKHIVRYCAVQERCTAEVKQKLRALGATEKTVGNMVDFLIRGNLLNEERYARSFARGKFRMKKWGRRKISYELRAKGLADENIRLGLSEIPDREYRDMLDQLIHRKLMEIKAKTDDFTGKLKVMRYCAEKGFEPELVSELLDLQG